MSDIKTLAAVAARDLATQGELDGLVARDKTGRFAEIAADFLELAGKYGTSFGQDRDRAGKELAAVAATIRLTLRDERITASPQGNGADVLGKILEGAGAVFAVMVRSAASGLAEGAVKGIAGGLVG